MSGSPVARCVFEPARDGQDIGSGGKLDGISAGKRVRLLDRGSQRTSAAVIGALTISRSSVTIKRRVDYESRCKA